MLVLYQCFLTFPFPMQNYCRSNLPEQNMQKLVLFVCTRINLEGTERRVGGSREIQGTCSLKSSLDYRYKYIKDGAPFICLCWPINTVPSSSVHSTKAALLKARCLYFPSPFCSLFYFSNASIPGYPFFGNITVTRSCEEECVTYEGIGSNRPTTCCYTDLCTEDTRSSKGERSSSAALGVMAMIFGTLLQCVLWCWWVSVLQSKHSHSSLCQDLNFEIPWENFFTQVCLHPSSALWIQWDSSQKFGHSELKSSNFHFPADINRCSSPMVASVSQNPHLTLQLSSLGSRGG